jgi:hypothetical protein
MRKGGGRNLLEMSHGHFDFVCSAYSVGLLERHRSVTKHASSRQGKLTHTQSKERV